jgi:hypothetical protein
VSGFAIDPCDQCEELLQPFLDRDLSEEERMVAEEHLTGCEYCRKRYRFESGCGVSSGRRWRSRCRRS